MVKCDVNLNISLAVAKVQDAFDSIFVCFSLILQLDSIIAILQKYLISGMIGLNQFYCRYQLPHILGLVSGVMSVVVILWTDVEDGRGGVSAGGQDRMTGDSLALLSGALTGVMQVMYSLQYQGTHRGDKEISFGPSSNIVAQSPWGAVQLKSGKLNFCSILADGKDKGANALNFFHVKIKSEK